jgi:multidrug resistance efflux pump
MRKWLLPLGLAVLSFAFAIFHAVRAQQRPPAPPPLVEPARSPYGSCVAGAGLVEPQTENIALGAHVAGIVQQVLVKVGQPVAAGAPLFRLDDRQLQAELKVRQANLAAAEAKLRRTLDQPRPEELPAAEARVREAQATLRSEQDQLERIHDLQRQRAAAPEEIIRREQATSVAREQLARMRADLALLRAGAWEPDRLINRTEVAQARAQVEQTLIELDRLQVRAPVDGEVLQVNVRPGEFVGAPPGQALVVLGNVHKLHLRADIDEHDIARFSCEAPATASVRGTPERKYTLRFVRVEPYVIPKKSLTGSTTERVDTRVLQVIYAIEPGPHRLYVGQQMDVYIDAAYPDARAAHVEPATASGTTSTLVRSPHVSE